MRDKVLLAGVLVAAVLALLPANQRSVAIAGTSGGGTESTSMEVLVTVAATGSITGSSNLDFGNFDNSGPLDGSTTVSVQVSNGGAYDVAIDAGSNFDGTTRLMRMNQGGGGESQPPATEIPYFLYLDDTRSSEWGDSGRGDTYTSGFPYAGTGDGTSQDLTVYGRIPVMANAPAPGDYNDFVTVTLNF